MCNDTVFSKTFFWKKDIEFLYIIYQHILPAGVYLLYKKYGSRKTGEL